jgi:diguanylate cyclase (GGDEF)-like protein/PAS domain S-box-containing protein
MPSTSRTRLKHDEFAPVWNQSARGRRPLRILFVHINDPLVQQCLHEFEAAHFKVTSNAVMTPEEFANRLDSKSHDLVLVGYPPLNWQGPGALELLRLKDSRTPLIFLTDTLQREAVAELLSEGAADCVEIGHLGHLPVAARRALNENRLRQERDLTEKKLRHSEARYRALVGNLTYGMCRCNSKGKFLDVNQALVTMLGYPSREELLTANHASEILCDASKRAQLLGRSTGKGGQDGGGSLELDWNRKDGTPLKVRLSGREVSNEGESEGYEIIIEDVTQQRKLEDCLRQEAAKDPLTGLANYRHFVEVIDTEIKRSERTSRVFALLFLDLDGLKKINDRFGHLVGSESLCRLADVLCNCSREMDTPARFGGDEFAVVLPETGALSASVVAQRICESLANDGREPALSVSVGVAIYPKDGETIEALLGAADAALYSIKTGVRKPAVSNSKNSGPLRHNAAAAGKTRVTNP